MCFYIDNKHSQPKVATKEIVCYKRIKKTTIAGKTVYSSPHRSTNEWFPRVDSKKAARVVKMDPLGGTINRGYHTYTSLKEAILRRNGKWNEIIVKFVIPKGTTYYYTSEDKQYVSESLLWKKIVKDAPKFNQN